MSIKGPMVFTVDMEAMSAFMWRLGILPRDISVVDVMEGISIKGMVKVNFVTDRDICLSEKEGEALAHRISKVANRISQEEMEVCNG